MSSVTLPAPWRASINTCPLPPEVHEEGTEEGQEGLTKPLIIGTLIEPMMKEWYDQVMEDPKAGMWMMNQSIFGK